MGGILLLAALPLMLLVGLLLDVATDDDGDPPEDAPPEVSDLPDEDQPLA